MKWLLTYRPYKDKVEVTGRFDVPYAKSFKQVRRWWRQSEHKTKKLVKGIKLEL